ncbi:hypothetical protein N8I77_002675 [Diaporthe amygdali]|uniref:Prion-inhibition and propagation HeLo domain-containing protein n=1 Tax=Phomopsis amygdali TaxID=1214568 RepID=A0AAD9SUR0_PHOAM|nr:hypothetical protein N8I77_002675 [Diaporthe amygdali]
MELSGLVIGVAGIVLAFKGAIDAALLIETFLDDGKKSCGYLALRYLIEKTRLQLWGTLVQADGTFKEDECLLLDRPEYVKKLVVGILAEIEELVKDAEKLVTKYDIATPQQPAQKSFNLDESLRNAVVSPTSQSSNLRFKPQKRFMWQIKGKEEFEETVVKFGMLVDKLESITLDPAKSHLLTQAVAPKTLVQINNPQLLQILDDPQNSVDSILAASARIKLFQATFSPLSTSVPAIMDKDRFKLFNDSDKFGSIQGQGLRLPVWVEWNVVEANHSARQYVKRITWLGQLLKQISEPALRLPKCHGMFEDHEYEVKFGERKIGYLFSPPAPSPTQLGQRAYESNLKKFPPKSLRELIIARQSSSDIPNLGDRFNLALVLAIAFSHFHAAGWLHKGLHSGNILYDDSVAGPSLSINEPFISGFQFSRPQQEASLSKGPLEDTKLEQYYHPEAHRGFTKQRDLYSLGVVLVEIGRWALVESVSESTRRKLKDRNAWQKYLLAKHVPELGWRMGRRYQSVTRTLLQGSLPDDDDDDVLFEQEYFNKVLQPLSSNTA